MTAQTTVQRQLAWRKRRAAEGITEVRGIFLPTSMHPALRRKAKELKASGTAPGHPGPLSACVPLDSKHSRELDHPSDRPFSPES